MWIHIYIYYIYRDQNRLSKVGDSPSYLKGESGDTDLARAVSTGKNWRIHRGQEA